MPHANDHRRVNLSQANHSKLTVSCRANCCAWPKNQMALPEEMAITLSSIMASHHITKGWLATFFLKQRESCLPCLLQSATNVHNGWPRLQLNCTLYTVHTNPWRLQMRRRRKTKHEFYSQQPAWLLDYWIIGLLACWVEAEAELIFLLFKNICILNITPCKVLV